MVLEYEIVSIRALRAASRRVRQPTEVTRWFVLLPERRETARSAAKTQQLKAA